MDNDGIIEILQSAVAGEGGGGNQVNSIVTQPQSSYFPLPSPGIKLWPIPKPGSRSAIDFFYQSLFAIVSYSESMSYFLLLPSSAGRAIILDSFGIKSCFSSLIEHRKLTCGSQKIEM